ncbi:MAG: response regulator [Nitrospira sp.]|nr:response regulator [Nitrospira sp.]
MVALKTYPVGLPTTTPIKDPQLLHQQVAHLYALAPVGIVASLINGPLLAFILRNIIAGEVLIGWLTGLLVVNALWCVLAACYRRQAPAPADTHKWLIWFVGGNAASGIVWGGAGFFLYPTTSIPHEIFLAFVLGGMIAGSTAVHAARHEAFLAYSLPTVGPLTLRFFQQGNELHIAMGIMALLFFAMMMLTARHNRAMIEQSLLLQFENSLLVKDLLRARDQAEHTNVILSSEIAHRRTVEKELVAHRDQLEAQVEARTSDLKTSEARYRYLAEHITDVIWAMELDGSRFSYMSSSVQQFRGYSPEEAVRLSLEETLTPESAQAAKRLIEEELLLEQAGTGDPQRFRTLELEHRCKDGSTKWTEVRGSFARDEHGKAIGILGITRDISERRKIEEEKRHLEAQLLQAKKMEAMGTLAGGIAHDFNNILGAILGYAELGITQISPNHKVKSYLEEVLAAGLRAKELVKQILSFSRRSSQERVAVDLKAILKESLTMLRATLPATIEIRSALEVDEAVVFADATQLHQVVMNLAANAEYAMRNDGGILDVRLTSLELTPISVVEFPSLKPGTYLQLTIRDTGRGIPAQTLERIFEPFFTTKGKGEGTGLGLSVVHGVVIGHRGHIAVTSTRGQGTTFTILLPRLDVVLPARSEHPEEWPTGSGRVLYVDDEEMLAKWGEQLLTHLGYAVVATTNPHEALDLFRMQPKQFDLVVTDQTMPAMNGQAFARALLAIREDIPIILCTGFSHNMTAEKAAHLGLSAFLMKPVNAAALARTVKRALKTSQSHANNT